ncbi:MAG: hypothetical protein WD768_13905 [Phycisphaeraceae bacterium]
MSKDTENLQRMLDALRGGETAELEPHLFPREIKGPISIKKPITLDGCNVTLWAIKGPVLSIETPGVMLRNMMIEVTGNHAGDGSEAACAIRVYGAKSIKVENVEVRGAVIGLREEEGSWRYPASLSLGRLSWDKDYDLVARIEVPVACKVSSNVDGLRITPSTIGPGIVDLHLHIQAHDIRRDTLLHGAIHLQTANLKRRINVSGHVLEEDPRFPVAALLWDPSGVPTAPPSVGDESEAEIEEVAPAPAAPTAPTETRIDPASVPPVYPPSDPNASVPPAPPRSSAPPARPTPPAPPKAAPPPQPVTPAAQAPAPPPVKPPAPSSPASIPVDYGHSRVRRQSDGLGSAFGSGAGESIPASPSSRRSSSSRSGSVPLGSAFAPPPPPPEQAAEAAAVSGAAPDQPANDPAPPAPPAPVNSAPSPAPPPAAPPVKPAKGPSKPSVVPAPPPSLPPAPTSVRIKGAPISPLFGGKAAKPEEEKKSQDKTDKTDKTAKSEKAAPESRDQSPPSTPEKSRSVPTKQPGVSGFFTEKPGKD